VLGCSATEKKKNQNTLALKLMLSAMKLYFLNISIQTDWHVYSKTRKKTDENCRVSGENCTYLHTPWRRVFLENLAGLQLVEKFSAFYGTRRFITAFTSARHLSLSWASSIQSTPPHHTFWRSNIILSSHLHLSFPSGPFPSGLPTKTLCTPLHSPIRATCPSHLIILDFINRKILGEEYR